MKVKTEYVVLGGVLLIAAFGMSFRQRLLDKLAQFIPSVEGFRSKPYWDVSRYSWGYGTAAPNSTSTITREKAFTEMVSYLMSDYATLSKKITRRLSVNQWAALLSFSYNLGTDDAIDIVPLINSNNDAALGKEWNLYVHSGGVVNSNLVDRRQKEWELWNS